MRGRFGMVAAVVGLMMALVGRADGPALAAALANGKQSTIRIANPLSDQSYSKRITVQAVANDVVEMVYQVDSQPSVAMSYSASAKQWQAALDTAKLTNGKHHVIVRARTSSGQTIEDRAWNIRVANTFSPTPTPAGRPPSIRIANPLSDKSYSGRIMVQAVVQDVASVVYQVDTGATVAMAYHAGSGTWEAALDTAKLSPGNHHVTVIARNAAGLTAQDRAWNIRVQANRATPTSTPLPSNPSTPGSNRSNPNVTFLRGVNLAGAEFGETKLPGKLNTDYTYPTSTELDYFRTQGLTLIRLPFRWERLQRALYGPLDPKELAEIDAVVTAARSRNMQVLLDLHNFARYHGDLIGSPKVPNDAFADVWRKIATHYRDESAVWAYGLMNEPHDTKGLWPAAAQAGVDGIRSVDMRHTILVAGDGWSGAHSWPEQNRALAIVDPANNFMYEAHQYFDEDHSGSYKKSYDKSGAYPTIGVDRAKPFVEWLKARNARGFFGEYGVPDNDARWNVVLENFMTYLDTNGMGGTYWAAGPWWGDYPLSVAPRNGTDRPQMDVLKRHLGRQTP